MTHGQRNIKLVLSPVTDELKKLFALSQEPRCSVSTTSC